MYFFLGCRRPSRSAHLPFSALVSLSQSKSLIFVVHIHPLISLFSICLSALHLGEIFKGAATALTDFSAVLCILYFSRLYHLGGGESHILLKTRSRYFLKFSSVFYSNWFPEAYFSRIPFRTGKKSSYLVFVL